MYVPVVDVGCSQDEERQLCESKGTVIDRAVWWDVIWCAYHKSADT
jgi:hypothetical protein